MSLRTTRNLQLADTFFEQQRVYSPGCIAARAGQVYSIGARTAFAFKYRLQLSPAVAEQPGVEEAAAEQSVHEEVEVAGVATEEEEEEYGSSEDEFLDAVPVGDASNDLRASNNEVEYDASAAPVQDSAKGSLFLASGADLALFAAQDILEQRIQDYLQKKLIYCPGSGYENRDLTIDGVAVDLFSYGSGECDDDTRTSCLMTGTITLYQRFSNAQSSSLQSTQAGLESLRVGMDVENIFEEDDSIPISNVEFLGGVFDVGKPGELERRGISLGGIGDLGGGVAVSVIASTQNLIQSQGASLSHTGQGIVAIFAMALFALVVARRRKRARHARAAVQDNNGGLDSGEKNLSDKDSWNEDGFIADETETERKDDFDDTADDDDDPLESVEVYLVNRPNERDAFSRIFGLSKKKKRKEIDHISLSGLHG